MGLRRSNSQASTSLFLNVHSNQKNYFLRRKQIKIKCAFRTGVDNHPPKRQSLWICLSQTLSRQKPVSPALSPEEPAQVLQGIATQILFFLKDLTLKSHLSCACSLQSQHWRRRQHRTQLGSPILTESSQPWRDDNNKKHAKRQEHHKWKGTVRTGWEVLMQEEFRLREVVLPPSFYTGPMGWEACGEATTTAAL